MAVARYGDDVYGVFEAGSIFTIPQRIFSGSARGRRSRNHDHSYVIPGCNHILTLLLECEVLDGGRTIR